MSVNIEDLIKMGFTYEDLYKKGILMVKPDDPTPEGDPDPDPAPEGDPDPDPDPAPNGDPDPKDDMEKLVKSYVAAAAAEIKKEIQKMNLQSVERSDDKDKKMTLDDAIIGLVKGM